MNNLAQALPLLVAQFVIKPLGFMVRLIIQEVNDVVKLYTIYMLNRSCS